MTYATEKIHAVILAAGDGTRMNSDRPKILHAVGRKPMLGHVMDTVRAAGINRIFVITGYKSDEVQAYVGSQAQCVEQRQRRGTADAVMQVQSEAILQDPDARLLVIYGDTPLIRVETVRRLLAAHFAPDAAGTLLAAKIKDPTGYGRIVRNDADGVIKIVEEPDCSVFERAIEEINVGLYVFKSSVLFAALRLIKPTNKKNEYYLTDVIEVLHKQNLLVNAITTDDADEILGVNSRQGLARAYEIYRTRVLEKLVDSGVTVLDPHTTFIDEAVTIGRDSVIYPFTVIEPQVTIGRNCAIGPFCRIRSGCAVGDGVSLGNFVELNRSTVGADSRIKHHSYVGDTTIGQRVNIGAGTIVANYDGKKKHRTEIADDAFIGTGTILVAPVNVGRGAMTGAGAVVTKGKHVPDGATVVGVPARELKKKSLQGK